MNWSKKAILQAQCSRWSKPLSSSIAERYGGLLDLLTTLQLQQA
jgi:hypothetical protein